MRDVCAIPLKMYNILIDLPPRHHYYYCHKSYSYGRLSYIKYRYTIIMSYYARTYRLGCCDDDVFIAKRFSKKKKIRVKHYGLGQSQPAPG